MDILLVGLIAFLTLMVPGELFAFALLQKTKLKLFEISVIGFIFGLVAVPTLTWLESYLMNVVHFFAFSLALVEVNALVLSIIGIILCLWQGVFKLGSIGSLSRRSEAKSEIASLESMKENSRMELSELRQHLRSYDAAKSIIEKHIEEEKVLSERHSRELNAINLSESERERINALQKDERNRLIADHEQEERILLNKLSTKPASAAASPKQPFTINKTYLILALLMLLVFGTRMMSIGIAPKFFEFDPYFDMLSAESILTFGYQIYLSPSAWPVVPAGTSMRIQPLVPYLEAYWYDLANAFGAHLTTFSTSLMSYVGGIYPPITAALLVFTVFILLYYEYGNKIALIGAALASTMPVLYTTFVAGEQLLEPWGIFTLFFFFAAYTLAIRDMKSKRLAILAGIAFATTFLGAHYYTVDTGVLAIYIIVQGIVNVLQGRDNKDFYKMNVIVLIVIAIFLAMYNPYHASLSGRIPSILGIPITISGPLIALIVVAVIDFGPKLLSSRKILFDEPDQKAYLIWILIILAVALLAVGFTPVGKPITAYINLSKHFTTPNTPLFMTVEEFIPTGALYNFGSSGFGMIGADIAGVPLLVWVISIIALVMIVLSIFYKKSTTSVLYLSIAAPLMFAGFSEVKYLPHFGTVFILLFCIMLGEGIYIFRNGFKLKHAEAAIISILVAAGAILIMMGSFYGIILAIVLGIAGGFVYEFATKTKYNDLFEPKPVKNAELYVVGALSLGVFFISPIFALIFVIALILLHKMDDYRKQLWGIFIVFAIIFVAGTLVSGSLMLGEISSITSALSSSALYSSSPSTACSTIASTSSIGYDLFCNVVPSYWLSAAAWMRANVGPYAPRILAWWDYGDWINWFGHSNAVIRGDNSVPKEDYATAASYVLGPTDNYTPATLRDVMNTNQTRYIVFDQGLIQKWQALDFLACVNINATSRAYAIAQGAAQTPPVPYALGTSPCELEHDPEYAFLPLAALEGSNSSQSINYYCSISNSTNFYIKAYTAVGDSLSNTTVCVSTTPTKNGDIQLYNSNGTKINAMIPLSYDLGVTSINGIDFVEYFVAYTPNGPNDSITDAPSKFYDSNFYKGFMFGSLPGFTQVYPNVTSTPGENLINGTYPLRILEINNYTGGLPPVPSKPSYVHNNLTMP
ncbi:MAG: hypothetical protein M1544_01640 [Candidatus Marsarchaeota archaeon]|nr:hypothetical protein [Candidatus Marsarchaeota archaeon]MCL5102039.1 hypothetical protein [Candidatus Marsarchaeota archaeon]